MRGESLSLKSLQMAKPAFAQDKNFFSLVLSHEEVSCCPLSLLQGPSYTGPDLPAQAMSYPGCSLFPCTPRSPGSTQARLRCLIGSWFCKSHSWAERPQKLLRKSDGPRQSSCLFWFLNPFMFADGASTQVCSALPAQGACLRAVRMELSDSSSLQDTSFLFVPPRNSVCSGLAGALWLTLFCPASHTISTATEPSLFPPISPQIVLLPLTMDHYDPWVNISDMFCKEKGAACSHSC